MLGIAGDRDLFLAAVGADGTIIYLRITADINEKPLEEIVTKEISAHKQRRKKQWSLIALWNFLNGMGCLQKY